MLVGHEQSTKYLYSHVPGIHFYVEGLLHRSLKNVDFAASEALTIIIKAIIKAIPSASNWHHVELPEGHETPHTVDTAALSDITDVDNLGPLLFNHKSPTR